MPVLLYTAAVLPLCAVIRRLLLCLSERTLALPGPLTEWALRLLRPLSERILALPGPLLTQRILHMLSSLLSERVQRLLRTLRLRGALLRLILPFLIIAGIVHRSCSKAFAPDIKIFSFPDELLHSRSRFIVPVHLFLPFPYALRRTMHYD